MTEFEPKVALTPLPPYLLTQAGARSSAPRKLPRYPWSAPARPMAGGGSRRRVSGRALVREPGRRLPPLEPSSPRAAPCAASPAPEAFRGDRRLVETHRDFFKRRNYFKRWGKDTSSTQLPLKKLPPTNPPTKRASVQSPQTKPVTWTENTSTRSFVAHAISALLAIFPFTRCLAV